MNKIEDKFKARFELINSGRINGKEECGISFFNLLMGQNQNALFAYSNLFNYLSINREKIGRIIEIGTGNGGLSILFKIFSLIEECDFITYDIGSFGMQKEYDKIYKMLNIDFRKVNCFNSTSEISEEIAKDNITILLCDGGQKVDEFNYFCPFLKANDIILVHDFRDNRNNNDLYWNVQESHINQLENNIIKYNIEPFFYEEFYQAATFCGRKK